jgi:hypothetical protein
VTKRLDYIKGEMGRVDAQLKSLQERGGARQQEVRPRRRLLGRRARRRAPAWAARGAARFGDADAWSVDARRFLIC